MGTGPGTAKQQQHQTIVVARHWLRQFLLFGFTEHGWLVSPRKTPVMMPFLYYNYMDENLNLKPTISIFVVDFFWSIYILFIIVFFLLFPARCGGWIFLVVFFQS